MDPKVSFHTNLYLLMQHIRRRPIGTYIGNLRRWERLDRQSFDGLTQARLLEVLHYAKKHVPLYASGAWRQAQPDHLTGWPLLGRAALASHQLLLQSRISYPGALRRQSSGSSGPRIQVVYDPQAAAWSWANEYRALLWHGLPAGVEAVMIVHDMFGTKRTSRIQDFIKNKKTFLANCITSESLDEIAEQIVRRPPKLLWGVPSAVHQVVRHLAALYGGNLPRIPFIKLGGEQVYPFQRMEIEDRLGGRVFGVYGCAEIGMTAAECKYGSMHVFSENVHVEVMKDGNPVPPESEGELVVSSLTNRAMPLIRYQVGDQGRLSPEKCQCGLPHPVLRDLKRKSRDLYDIDGKSIPAIQLEASLEQLFAMSPPMALRQVLLEQKNQRQWKVYVESVRGFDERLASAMKTVVRDVAGSACEVDIERVPVIRKEKSEKLRYFRKDASQSAAAGRILEKISFAAEN